MSNAMRAAVNLYHDPMYFNKSEIRIRQNKIRREKEYRKQITILSFIAIILLSTLVFGFTTIRSNAESEEYKVEYKYYKNVVVGYGDSLWTIAQDNISYDHYEEIDDYITEVMNINHISNKNDVTGGTIITIPYYSEDFK